MKMIKRFSLLSFVFILACSIVGCQQIDASQEQKQFDQFIQQEFVKTMENDYVATHIYMQNPESFGIDLSKTEVSLGARPKDDARQRRHALHARLGRLRSAAHHLRVPRRIGRAAGSLLGIGRGEHARRRHARHDGAADRRTARLLRLLF